MMIQHSRKGTETVYGLNCSRKVKNLLLQPLSCKLNKIKELNNT